MNVIAEITRINQLELNRGIVATSASWHEKYKQSAWVFCGNLPTSLSEGDIICIMSQFGEVEDLNLVREDGATGTSKGFCFCKYEDQRSTVLAVDNLTGTNILGRSIRVDHVEQYRLPKELLEQEEARRNLGAGHAYEGVDLANEFNIHQGQDLFAGGTRRAEPFLDHKSDDGVDDEKSKRKLAKQERKKERDIKRKERESRREEKEDKRRMTRANKLRDDDNEKLNKSGKDRRKEAKKEYYVIDMKEYRTKDKKRRRDDDAKANDRKRSSSIKEEDTDDNVQGRANSRYDSD